MKIGKFSLHESGSWKDVVAVFLFLAIGTIGSSAQTFNTLLSFDGSDGSGPNVLIQGFDGNFYGTTGSGGTHGDGTFFKATPAGTLTTIYNFCAQTNCVDGERPVTVVQGRDGNFYGVTLLGGQLSCGISGSGCGTIFKINATGTLTTLHTFTDSSDGGYPATLLQSTDGYFYGVTGISPHNVGTVFKITAAGTLTTLHTFKGSDGGSPEGLMQATDGNFYGTTVNGGSGLGGTVFKITPAGTLTTLVFLSEEGPSHPLGGLVQASDGNFYGTTTNSNSSDPYGTVFQMTPSGTLSVIYSFCRRTINCPGGNYPEAVLVQGTDGNLYGTTTLGGGHNGPSGCGTVFQITLTGTLTTLHDFDLTDGCNPVAALLQDTNGNFYGTTSGGGANSVGTIFNLDMGLGPFVTTNPTMGKAGTRVGILGTNLKGATAVSFNGTAAKFSVTGKSVIVATVPAGATTGFVTVTTPSGTLTSNVPFQIVP